MLIQAAGQVGASGSAHVDQHGRHAEVAGEAQLLLQGLAHNLLLVYNISNSKCESKTFYLKKKKTKTKICQIYPA